MANRRSANVSVGTLERGHSSLADLSNGDIELAAHLVISEQPRAQGG